mgnify:FL=1
MKKTNQELHTQTTSQKEFLALLKKDFNIKDKEGKISTLNSLGHKLKKRAYTIYWLNMTAFVLLCLGVFLYFVSPAILWVIGHGPGSETFVHHFKKLTIIGIVLVIVTLLYGLLVFWVLLVKCSFLTHQKHNIYLYLGVRVVVLVVDEKVVAYCKYGYFTVPTATWCAKLDHDQMIRFELKGKNKYSLDINWYSESTYERYIKQLHTVDNKKSYREDKRLNDDIPL